jgi:hypothetical protein
MFSEVELIPVLTYHYSVYMPFTSNSRFACARPFSTLWIYLFFLPFQLVSQFGYSTIPGVAIAAFIYLGFLAAGEEIEQPFGYEFAQWSSTTRIKIIKIKFPLE